MRRYTLLAVAIAIVIAIIVPRARRKTRRD
jgi:hypothetical protein